MGCNAVALPRAIGFLGLMISLTIGAALMSISRGDLCGECAVAEEGVRLMHLSGIVNLFKYLVK
jgi:hypothetical protein